LKELDLFGEYKGGKDFKLVIPKMMATVHVHVGWIVDCGSWIVDCGLDPKIKGGTCKILLVASWHQIPAWLAQCANNDVSLGCMDANSWMPNNLDILNLFPFFTTVYELGFAKAFPAQIVEEMKSCLSVVL
jgi:hypothetical protein